MRRLGYGLPFVFALVLPSLVLAQEEMNWQHIDPPDEMKLEFNDLRVGVLFPDGSAGTRALSVRIDGPSHRVVNAGRFGHLLTGRKVRINGMGTAPITVQSSVGLCQFGFRLAGFDIHPQKKNRRKYAFTFYDLQGEVIGVESRWPAGGMTRQAFKPKSGGTPFGAVKIEELGGFGFGIRSVKATPCADILG